MKNYFLIAVLAAMTLAVAACGSDKKDEPNDFSEGIYYDERSSDREYIETVASKVLEFVKPSEQYDALVGLHAFIDLLNTYQLPDNFHDTGSLKASARALADAIEDYDCYTLSRAAANFVYNLARFNGMYQAAPDSYVWVKVEARDDIRFKFFVGKDNTEYNVNVSGSGTVSRISVNDNGVTYQIEVPKVLDMTMAKGSIASPKTVIAVKLQTDIRDNESINLTTNATLGSIVVESTLKGNNSKITEDMTLYRDNPLTYVRTTLVSATATLTGSNMCSVSAWQRAAQNDNISSIVSSASSTSMIYSSIQIKTNVNNIKTFVDNAFDYWSSYDSPDPKGMAQRAASNLNSAVTAEVRYSGDNKDKLRGTLGWQPYQCDDWADYQEWEVRPTITFTKDGVTHEVGSYFGNGHFLSVENTVNSLLSTYRSYWK